MLELLLAWIASTILLLGYPGVFALMALEVIILPLPSEIILPFAGYLVSNGEMNIVALVLAATCGSVVGSWILYEISARGKTFLYKYGKFLFLDPEHIEWAQNWFLRYGDKTIFFSRLLPFVRIFINIPAGMTGMNRPKFLLYTFAGALLWNLLLVLIGVALGKEWQTITQYTQPVELVILGLLGTIFAWMLFKKLERKTLPYLKSKGEEWAKRVHLKRDGSSPKNKGL